MSHVNMKMRRIQAGLAAINAHIAAKNKELIGPRNGSPVIDLLADLMHYCAAAEVDFDEQLRLCRVHFHAEKEDGIDND